jgi:hypothetical protein
VIESFSDAVNMWNCFHDGSIAKVTRTDSQTYEVEIEIDYLMEEITGKEEGIFRIVLEGCQRFEFEPFVFGPCELNTTFDVPFDSEIYIVVLSSEVKDDQLVIYCGGYEDSTKAFDSGILHLKYDACKLFLMNTEFTLVQLNDAQQSYWDKFGN